MLCDSGTELAQQKRVRELLSLSGQMHLFCKLLHLLSAMNLPVVDRAFCFCRFR
jgi:hypothetical protein